jgi:CO/xanthine dehydrogenase FAD-binding subunit
MKPPIFDYIAPTSIEAAVAALTEAEGEAKVLAGGQSLMPMLNFRLLRPSILVDVNRIAGLSFIAETPDSIRVGALTRHFALETSPLIAARFPVLSAAMTYVAHLAIRNRGTIGGSLSHADPAAELPMMALLLDAELHVAAVSGTRAVAARNFFLDTMTVALDSAELLTEIVLPKLPPQTGWGFEEVARRHGDFALAAVAATLTLSHSKIAQARIALTGVGPTALRATGAERLLIGQSLDGDATAGAIAAVRDRIEPETDLHASSDYRRHLAGVLTGRALTAAWRRAQNPSAGAA